MIRVYGIKNCDSVKKALRFLDTHALQYDFHDFKLSPVSRDIINQWSETVGIDILLNTKGTTYRTLGLKSLDLDENQKIMWMVDHNLLIKRPVIEYDGKLIVGFDQTKYEGAFLA